MNIKDLPKKSLSQEVYDSTLNPLEIFNPSDLYSENTKYNQILQNRELFLRNGTVVEVVLMSPLEYIRRCSLGFNRSIKDNIKILDIEKIERYSEAMRRKQKFPLPILVYNSIRGTFLQEGRHRAITSYYLGFEKIPVCIIRISDQKTLDMIDHRWTDSVPR